MERALFGKDKEEEMVSPTSSSCIYIRKGDTHTTCDDAVLWYADDTKQFQLLVVCDGISGESFGYKAAETAIKEIRNGIIFGFGKIKNKILLQNAIIKAHKTIQQGATTASVVLLLPNGTFFFANVGDSHIYKITDKKVKRLSSDEKETVGTIIEAYRVTRRFVVQALGAQIKKIHAGRGKLKKDELLLAATDGFCDNFFIETKKEIVTSANGENDIALIIGNKKEPKEIIETLVKEIKKRMQSTEDIQRKDQILIPKNDDLAVGVITFKNPKSVS